MRWLKRFKSKWGRRREHERFSHAAKLSAKCASWPRFVDLFSSDISKGGLFIPTKERAAVGEKVTIDLALPDGHNLTVEGVVVRLIDDELAKRLGKPKGLGIKLKPPEGEDAAKFQKLLDLAAAGRPVPEDLFADGEPSPPPAPKAAPRADSQPLEQEFVERVTSQQPARPKPPLPTPEHASLPKVRPGAAAKDDTIIGIDMGTSYTAVAAVKGGKVIVFPRRTGERSTASVLWFPGEGKEPIVGPQAREKLATNPAHTIGSPKRLLGRPVSDREVENFLAQAAYDSKPGPGNQPLIEMWGQPYAVSQLCSFLIQDIVDVAAMHLGERPTKAVLSVPVSFDDDRLQHLRRTMQLARVELIDVIDEPSAAALANRSDSSFGGVVGVYDFGGGTFDFSVVDVSGGDFQVIATAGDSWLGGDDFDLAMAEAVANQFWRQHNIELRHNKISWQRLLHGCEKAKRALSSQDQALVSVKEIQLTAKGMLDVNVTVSRQAMAKLSQTLVARSLETCQSALELLDIRPNELNAVYLSGGTTYMPTIQAALKRFFQVPIRSGVPPEFAVCLGASIHAAQLQRRVATTLDSLVT